MRSNLWRTFQSVRHFVHDRVQRVSNSQSDTVRFNTMVRIVDGHLPLAKYRYMVAQIFGAYLAVLLVYSQWHVYIKVRRVLSHCPKYGPREIDMYSGI